MGVCQSTDPWVCCIFVQRQIQGGARVCTLPFFCNHYFFYNHFEELQTVLFKVELIINNAPLAYVYPNTIKTCLTPNHLLLDIQLLYPSNTISTVVRNLTILSSTSNRINCISNHFLETRICSKFTSDRANIKFKYKLSKN